MGGSSEFVCLICHQQIADPWEMRCCLVQCAFPMSTILLGPQCMTKQVGKVDGDERDRGAVGWGGMGAFHKYSATCFYTRRSQDFQLPSGPDIVRLLSSVPWLLYPPPFHWSRESRNHTARLLDPAVTSAGVLERP